MEQAYHKVDSNYKTSKIPVPRLQRGPKDYWQGQAHLVLELAAVRSTQISQSVAPSSEYFLYLSPKVNDHFFAEVGQEFRNPDLIDME